jgi:tetratricopeptide (TPR) repeat protein
MVASSGTPVSASVDSAQTMIAAGRFNEALTSLESLDAQDAESLFLRGVVLAELDRNAEAESMFRDLIERFPDYPEPYNNLAVLLAGSGRFEEAVETLKSALRTHPSYRTAWDNLTTIYGRLASEAYSRALNVESAGQAAPVKLALLGSLSRADESAMGPVETIPAVAVAPVSQTPVTETPTPAEPLAEVSDASISDEEEMLADEEQGEELAQIIEEQPEAIPAAEAIDDAEPEVSEADPSPAELTMLVESWAAAWSGQRADDYLSFYSASFTPDDGMALSEWKELRRSRLAAPEYIRVSVAFLDYEFAGDEATVVFNQSYESNTFSDLVTKTLVLTREDGAWKIARETVRP